MRVLVLLGLLLGALPAVAQSNPPANPPGLLVKGESKSLRLSQVETQVHVAGALSETKTIVTFCNSLGRVLEGTLHFPLPEGATVSGYGLDVNGQMVDGVIVEKDKGRVVFEKEVRRGVDPGLVEWTRGNVFNTRVYPIPAKGCRKISVSFVTHLNQSADGARYILPLNYKDSLDDFTLRLSVVGTSERPKITWPAQGGIQLTGKDSRYVGGASLRGQPLVGQLEVALLGKGAQHVVEQSPAGETHFFVSDLVPKNVAPATTAAPKKVTVLWDVSGSRAGKHDKEVATLEAYLKRFNKTAIAVTLQPFSNTLHAPQSFAVNNGDTHALLAAVRNLTYDGGTQFSVVSPVKGTAAPDVYLLFSDGLSTFGAPDAGGFVAPVFAFSDDVNTHATYLKWLTQQSGGDYFHLAALKPEQAAAQVGGKRLAIVSINATSGTLRHAYPRVGTPVQGPLLITGKLDTPTATVVVELGMAGQVTQRLTYVLSGKSEGNLVARYWAQQKVQELSVFAERNQQGLIDLGKRYGLVTPATSLIVLERLEQYVEHDIRPPTSLVAMRAEYDSRQKVKAAEAKRQEAGKLEHIVALWNARVQWWQRKFEYPPNFRYGEPKAKKSRNGGGEGRGMGMAGGAHDEADMSERESLAPPASRLASPAADMAKSDRKGADAAAPEPGIELQPWSPDTPYLKALKAAAPAQREAVYLTQKATYGSSPAFFLDCADFFGAQKDAARALRVLSNIAELELDNAALLRVLGHRLRQLEHLELARLVFEEVLRLRPEEPQSYRDLAQVLADLKRYAPAMALLQHVVMNQWDRFDEIEVIALMELNRILPMAKAMGVEPSNLDARLVSPMDLDIRISLSWDADLTDIDLWVEEPSGERVDYSHNLSTIGGLVSRDFTQGYGPEEYVLKKAMRGTYTVKTNFFGSSAQALTGAVTLQLELFTNYGRPNEKKQSITIRLTDTKETFTVGALKF